VLESEGIQQSEEKAVKNISSKKNHHHFGIEEDLPELNRPVFDLEKQAIIKDHLQKSLAMEFDRVHTNSRLSQQADSLEVEEEKRQGEPLKQMVKQFRSQNNAQIKISKCSTAEVATFQTQSDEQICHPAASIVLH